MNHLCHAANCKTKVPPKLLMCAKHWRMVPKDIQRRVWKTYRPGQERDKEPSDAYLHAQQSAIAHVALEEGNFDEAQKCYGLQRILEKRMRN